MERVLITGGSGLIGRNLSRLLLKNGYAVTHLGRVENLAGPIKTYRWNIAEGFIDARCMEGVSHIVHLAGEGIADKRWSEKRKAAIIDSRTKSAQLLMDALLKTGAQVRSLSGASAIGIYGAVTGDKVYVETDAAANDFLGSCCAAWERSYDPFLQQGIRTTILRIGVVVTKEGGALVKMANPVRKGFGSALGNGKQFVPWISMEDMCSILFRSITIQEMQGVYNAVAPQHMTNEGLTQAIAKQLNKKLWAPKVPAFVLRLMFGEMANMFLEGSRVSCGKLEKEGFRFNCATVEDALRDL